MTVDKTEPFKKAADEAYLRLVLDGAAGAPWAWECALRETVSALPIGAFAYPLCLDPKVQGLGLREAYFGAGRTKTHRLIFAIDGDVIRVRTVRSFSQPELTPADL